MPWFDTREAQDFETVSKAWGRDGMLEHGESRSRFQELRLAADAPGEGVADWALIMKRLEDFSYDGILSIEHEDGRYYSSWELEAEGFIRARAHLKRFMV